MNRCTYCGREADDETVYVRGYEILEWCSDCEDEILESEDLKMAFFVTMEDEFMSGWGKAEGKRNILVFLCDTAEEAKIVSTNANRRTDMENINIRRDAPSYDKRRFFVQYKSRADYPRWYEAGAF